MPIKYCSYLAISNWWSFVFENISWLASFLLTNIWVETFMSGFSSCSYIFNFLSSEDGSLTCSFLDSRSSLRQRRACFSLNRVISTLYSLTYFSFWVNTQSPTSLFLWGSWIYSSCICIPRRVLRWWAALVAWQASSFIFSFFLWK